MKTNAHGPNAWLRIQRRTLARNQRNNDGRCQAGFDGCLGVAREVHHVIERVNGGTDDDGNLVAICETCHTRLTVEANQARAYARREAEKAAKRKNHPGRRDRHE
ncbi:HNH endonuclease signature motif containing protein [Mycobacterium sp. TKK-01-0059]|uniref:HNH endonuclease signature motif containing protein n=1 Tax=Mycobacterium sp. TKK-01-0059 TaxID=1324269 RepID=UPI00056928C8|nr:HNH endonuclease signature motif containing protein [Mycobacterium sp. TKK-01-0059]